jgi:hypothetical protein
VREQKLEEPVGVVESRFGCGSLKNRELMPEGQVLEQGLGVRLKGGAERAEQGEKQSEHGRIRMAMVAPNSRLPTSTEFSLPTAGRMSFRTLHLHKVNGFYLQIT